MNLTEPTIVFLAKTICGDNGLMPRKKGPELMDFFSEYGHGDRKKGDFTNRLKFAESQLKLYNNTSVIAQIIEGSLQLREFFVSRIDREKSVKIINEQLKRDGYELIKLNDHFKAVHSNGSLIEAKNKLDHGFITEQIENCHQLIDNGQFQEAMQQAQDLLTSVMNALLESFDGHKTDGEKNFEERYTEVKKALKLNVVEPHLSPLGLVQILSGFESVIEGLSRLSQDADRHFVKSSPKKSWAMLMVNSSKTMAEFLVDYRENLL